MYRLYAFTRWATKPEPSACGIEFTNNTIVNDVALQSVNAAVAENIFVIWSAFLAFPLYFFYMPLIFGGRKLKKQWDTGAKSHHDGAPASGLKWRNVGSEKPSHGDELVSERLSDTLQQKTSLTKRERTECEVCRLTDREPVQEFLTDQFILSGDSYFQPTISAKGRVELACRKVVRVTLISLGFVMLLMKRVLCSLPGVPFLFDIWQLVTREEGGKWRHHKAWQLPSKAEVKQAALRGEPLRGPPDARPTPATFNRDTIRLIISDWFGGLLVAEVIHHVLFILNAFYSTFRRLILMTCGIWTEDMLDEFMILERASKVHEAERNQPGGSWKADAHDGVGALELKGRQTLKSHLETSERLHLL